MKTLLQYKLYPLYAALMTIIFVILYYYVYLDNSSGYWWPLQKSIDTGTLADATVPSVLFYVVQALLLLGVVILVGLYIKNHKSQRK